MYTGAAQWRDRLISTVDQYGTEVSFVGSENLKIIMHSGRDLFKVCWLIITPARASARSLRCCEGHRVQ